MPAAPPRLLAWLVGLIAIGSIARVDGGELAKITVEPAAIRLDGGRARQQVAITGQRADGGLVDLTAATSFAVEPAAVATVSAAGVVTPKADGAALLRFEVDGQAGEVPIEVVGSGTTKPASYRLDVAPILSKAGCNMGTCHGNFNGKGGFKLSLRGDDPAGDWFALTHDTFGRRLDRGQPDRSLLLLKPLGRLPHEGGPRFVEGSPEHRILADWIAAGAIDDRADAPRLVALRVEPGERILAAVGRTQQLIVTAEFTDGARRDVTRQASYDVSDPTAAEITADGRVLASKAGEVAVAIRYLDGRAVSRLAFLPERTGFAWAAPPENNEVDRLVFDRLRKLQVNPSPPADDATFLRRAYLDAIGILPTADEARTFLANPDPDKRDKLVDELLARPEFADHWALKWADLLRNEEKTMGAKGVWAFQRWLRDQIDADRPLDEFARDLLASKGSTWRNPPASFYRTNRDPETAAEAVGQIFLGVRLQCAKCHNHPFDVWTQDDYYGLSAYFANVRRKAINNVRRDGFDKHEINGDVLVYLDGEPQNVQPRTGTMMAPKPPGGPRPDLAGDPDALDDLAEWLTRENPQFARVMANRVWFHLIGRGVVEPVDDFRDSNPPSNPELLDGLTSALVRDQMRLRPLVALIMKSQAYGLSATPNDTNRDDESHFARAAVKLMPAESLLDAIGAVFERTETFDNAPRSARATQLPGTKSEGAFLKVFGKPDRLLTCECERSESTTLAQAFQLINGRDVRDRVEHPGNRLGRLIEAGADDRAILDEFYLAALARYPTEDERSGLAAHLDAATDRRRAWEDVAWAVVNSKEFLLRH